MAVEGHNPNCWCIVCGTDRIHTAMAEDQERRAKNKAARLFIVSPVDLSMLLEAPGDVILHVFATEDEAIAFAGELSKETHFGQNWYVHAFTRPARIVRGILITAKAEEREPHR